MISPDHAKGTVVMTTQRGVRTCLNPTLSHRFPANDKMLRYKRLPHMSTPHQLDGCVLIR
jgi:hypothetical protein